MAATIVPTETNRTILTELYDFTLASHSLSIPARILDDDFE